MIGIDVLSSSIEGLIGEPYSITTSSDFDEATVTFKINTENLEGELDEYCIIWYDGEDYYECQSSWYSSYGTSSSDLISANLPSKKGVVAVTERATCDRLVNGVELTEYYSSEIADTIFIVSGDCGGTPLTEGNQVEFIKDYLNSSERDVGTKTAYGSVEIITRFYDSAIIIGNITIGIARKKKWCSFLKELDSQQIGRVIDCE